MSNRSDDWVRYRKQQVYLRQTGRPSRIPLADVERALHRVRSFHARGMTYVQMARQCGVPPRTLAEAARRGRAYMRRVTWQPLMTIRFEEPDPHAWVSPVGARRRLHAMWLDGYPLPWLAERLGYGDRSYLQAFIRGTKGARGIRYCNAQAVADLYSKLDGADPADFGIGKQSASFAATSARKRGCAPRAVWDEDTIDDPQAIPEWTGACGTPQGWRIHRREGIPVCAACEDKGDESEPVFSPAKFRDLRVSKGFSQASLEEAVGAGNGLISMWERGEGWMYRSSTRRLQVLEKIMTQLDCTFDDISEEINE